MSTPKNDRQENLKTYFVAFKSIAGEISVLPNFVPDSRYTKPESIAKRIDELQKQFYNDASSFPGIGIVAKLKIAELSESELKEIEHPTTSHLPADFFQSRIIGADADNLFDLLVYQSAKYGDPVPLSAFFTKNCVELKRLFFANSYNVSLEYMVDQLKPGVMTGDSYLDAEKHFVALKNLWKI